MAILNQNVEVLADKPALVERAREIAIERIQTTIAAKGRFTIVLAGGSTPKPLYESLANEALPWSKIHFFWGDERYVPPTDSSSNERMARQALFDKIDLPAENIHPIKITGASPQEDARQHEAELREFFGKSSGFPTFDLILLGMGDDGHTASLFPQTEALSVKDRLITVGKKDGEPRITFTIPLINQANCVLFIVAGANKCPALQQVFAPQGDGIAYPSRQINPQGDLLWLLDRAAAADL